MKKDLDYKSINKESWNKPTKTVGATAMVLVATKTSRRTLRKGKKQYLYRLEGTKGIYYNESKNGVLFVPMARHECNMFDWTERFWEIQHS